MAQRAEFSRQMHGILSGTVGQRLCRQKSAINGSRDLALVDCRHNLRRTSHSASVALIVAGTLHPTPNCDSFRAASARCDQRHARLRLIHFGSGAYSLFILISIPSLLKEYR